jgi:tetratricopeptide (TPR) repeat protein
LVGALKEFSEAVRLAPNSAVAHYNKGRVLYDSGELKEAKAELETTCRLSPDYPSALYLLALAEEQMNNLSRSAELLKRLVQLDPHDSDAHYLFGQVMMRLGRTREAIEQWQIAVDTNPGSLKALHDLADLLSKVGRPEAGLYAGRFDALQKSQQLTDQVLQLDRFGVEAAKAQNWPEAVAQLKEALKLCGGCAQSANLHRDLGLTYCRKGELEGGEGELRTALTLNPNDADAHKALRILETLRNEQPTYH